MKLIKTLAGLLPWISVLTAQAEPAPEPMPQPWVSLFNGEDLDGWRVKITGHPLGDNFGETFRVEDGVLKVAYDGYDTFEGRFGHLFHERLFGDFRLRVEYRFTGEQVPEGPGWAFRNSGIMILGQTPESMAVDQEFPASIEVQLLGGRDQGERSTANLCTPGTHVVMAGELVRRHCTDSRSKTYRGDRWVTAEVEVRDGAVRHLVDGETVLEYREPQLDDRDADAQRLLAAGLPTLLRRGTISLQSESHPVEFRRVEILELDADAWLRPLEGGDLVRHWITTGNWRLSEAGVVQLTPRDGERGWNRFDAYLWLQGRYADFEAEFDYRLERGGNSGFYFHVGDRASPVAQGVEVQLYDTPSRGAGARLTDHDAGGIIPGIPPVANTARPAGAWNRCHVVVQDGAVTVTLNGVVVNHARLDQGPLAERPKQGAIGFQDHALPLSLRNVRVRRR